MVVGHGTAVSYPAILHGVKDYGAILHNCDKSIPEYGAKCAILMPDLCRICQIDQSP
jgi:hypothetical protein